MLYEVLQFVLAIGRSDITDIIENVLGGIIGIGIYVIISRLFKNEDKTLKFITICAKIPTICMVILLGTLVIFNL